LKLNQWISLFAFAVAIYILWRIRQVLLLVFTATILATALNRAVKRLQKSGVKRSVAVFVTIITVLSILIFFIIAIIPPLVSQSQQLTEKVPLGIERLNSWFFQWQEQLSIANPVIENLRDSITRLLQVPQPLRNQIFNNFFTLFSGTVNTIFSALVILVLTIMLLASPFQYREVLIQLFPASWRRQVDNILTRCEQKLSAWSIGLLFSMSVISLLSGIGLFALGVPLILANALLAGLLNFIPNVGPIFSVVPPMAIALLDAPWKAIAVLILYLLIQQVETNILTPLVMQKQVSLLPAATLVSQLIFAIFFGFFGLLLALPLTIILQVLVQELWIKGVLDQA
jgi:predicted PurR-regulated permease PerM